MYIVEISFDIKYSKYHMRAQILLQTGPHWYSESPTKPVFCRTVLRLTPPPPPPPPSLAAPGLFVPKLKIFNDLV